MRDLARQLAGETKCGRRVFRPAPDGRLRGSAVEGGIDLNGGKIMRIKFQPASRRQIRWIKVSPPFIKTPRASAEPDFLLCREIQGTFRRIIAFHRVKSCPGPARAGRMGRHLFAPANLTGAGKVATLRNAMKCLLSHTSFARLDLVRSARACRRVLLSLSPAKKRSTWPRATRK